MKKYVLLITMLALVASSFSQSSHNNYNIQEQVEAWNKKKRGFRATAITMVSVGTILIIAGIQSSLNSDGDGTSGGDVAITGMVLNFGSIPFTVLSHVYGKKVRKAQLSLSANTAPAMQTTGMLQKRIQPGVTFSFPVSRR